MYLDLARAKLAEFVVVDDDPFTVDEKRFKAHKVLETSVGGKVRGKLEKAGTLKNSAKAARASTLRVFSKVFRCKYTNYDK
jgi:hypothetical protein